MSLLASFTKKSKLSAAIKHTAEARKSEGSKADQLFKKAYQDYAEVVSDHPMLADALYNWGFALLHQAKIKSEHEAMSLYQDAIVKFSFCLTIDPNYLGAAIDGGVACMDLARVGAVGTDDDLYGMAASYFEKANAIQAGSASYNLACIYATQGNQSACQEALETSRNRGSLPNVDDILNDPDLDAIKTQAWFVDFIEALNKKPEVVEAEAQADSAVVAEEAATVEETAKQAKVAVEQAEDDAVKLESVVEEVVVKSEAVQTADVIEQAGVVVDDEEATKSVPRATSSAGD
jgi:tetratricopeptide (TPR) repeat protein